MYPKQRRMDCEYIDESGRKRYEKVYFVENAFSSDDQTAYRLNGFVAKGGNGTVFICYDSKTNEKLAVKFLHVLNRTRRERFEFECLVLNDLDHPNILPLRDTGLVETTYHRSSIPFMVTEFFTTNVQRRIATQGLFSIEEIKRFGSQMCDAFEYIHSLGIIHRDIKPGNFLIGNDRIVVSDFGLAKTHTEEGIDRFWRGDMTATDERVGSIPWMSSELFKYAKNKTIRIDERSDLYQLGRVLWYMHTGDEAGIPDPDDDQSGGKLHEIVFKAIQAKPKKRFQTAAEMRNALGEL